MSIQCRYGRGRHVERRMLSACYGKCYAYPNHAAFVKSHMKSSIWMAQSQRLTVFHQSPGRASAEKWWEGLFGEPPERRVLNPRVDGFQDEGSLNNHRLNLAFTPDKLDWVWTALTESPTAARYPSLGTMEETLSVFAERVVVPWLPAAPGVTRIAYGGIFIQPARSKDELAEVLSTYIHSLKVNSEPSDFLYQVNRPRVSNVGQGLRINRLSRWAGLRVRLLEVSSTADMTRTEELYALRLEVDINTDADSRELLDPTWLTPLYQELTHLGVEIAARGDLP